MGPASDRTIEEAGAAFAALRLKPHEKVGMSHVAQAARARASGPIVDVPSPFEQILLAAGEKKVEMKLDTRMPNTSIFTFNKEDHTLGNLLRARLLQDRRVTFAAYKVPHPLFPSFELRVQTDGSLNPKEALLTACRDTVSDLNTLSREFTKEYELRKMVNEGRENGV